MANDGMKASPEGEGNVHRLETRQVIVVGNRSFRIHAEHQHGAMVTIDLAAEAPSGERASYLRGAVSVSDLRSVAQSLTSLFNSLSAAIEPQRSLWLEGERRHFPNAYRTWTPNDDALLKQRFQSGDAVRDIAMDFGRRPIAIESRLAKLELIPDPRRRASEM